MTLMHEFVESRGAEPPPGDSFADALRVFGAPGTLTILVILAGNLIVVPLSTILVLVWAQRSGSPRLQLAVRNSLPLRLC